MNLTAKLTDAEAVVFLTVVRSYDPSRGIAPKLVSQTFFKAWTLILDKLSQFTQDSPDLPWPKSPSIIER